MPEEAVGQCARCWARWGGIGGGNFYIWKGMIYSTPIWDVLAARGKRVGAGEHLATRPRCPGSQLGRRCQLGFGLGFAPGLVGLAFS